MKDEQFDSCWLFEFQIEGLVAMIKRILIGLGGTPYTPVAIQRAIELAQQNEAEITAVTAMDLKRIMQRVPGDDQDTRHDQRQERLGVIKQRVEEATAELESACAAAGIKHTIQWELGDPFTRMAELARFHDLMIFGLRSLFDYDFGVEPRNALARLVAHGVHPILAVSNHNRKIQRVLLTYSGSPQSAAAIKRFVQLRLWPDAALRIVTFERPLDESKRLLAEAAKYCEKHGLNADVHYGPGKPQNLIPQHALEWEADLVVLGTSAEKLVYDDDWANSESGLAGFLRRQAVGTTSLHLIQNASRELFLSQ